MSLCDRPPAGWYCTRGARHVGPCAPRKAGAVLQAIQAFAKAIGEEIGQRDLEGDVREIVLDDRAWDRLRMDLRMHAFMPASFVLNTGSGSITVRRFERPRPASTDYESSDLDELELG